MGGRLKSSNLICKECNSKFGDSFDAKLSKQFEFFASDNEIVVFDKLAKNFLSIKIYQRLLRKIGFMIQMKKIQII